MSDPRAVVQDGTRAESFDPIVAHLTYEPLDVELTAIPWPEGLAPVPDNAYDAHAGGPLPQADVLVVTWTKAEWEALADVLTPGYKTSAWAVYTHNWPSFENHLTWKSPAKEAHCLGEFKLTSIAGKKVLCFHSQLHLATDDDTAPVVALWKQIITEAQPKLVITTGTAGGIGMSTVLGDVFIVGNAKFNCTKMFKSQPWAQERFSSRGAQTYKLASAGELLAVNASKLQPVATRDPQIAQGGDVETVDYFGFDDTDDSYHIVSNDPEAHTEEMDDATLPLALQQLDKETSWLSIRNASDPEVPSSVGTLEEQSKWASHIYQKYGYYTTVGSAIACWAVIADLG